MVQTIAQHSPFKFLDSYGREDRAIFFGREEEINALYELVMSSQLTLVYGASGTGKTSLIECGLGNRFSDTDWFAIRIRKCDDITQSTFQAIRDRSYPDKIIADTESSIYNAVQALYLFYYIPIYLIFDQFEELFISGTIEEQEHFFTQLSKVLETGKPCKIILVMREEYIGFLSQYEHIIPSLFDNKYRIEKMNQLKLQSVILGTIQTPQYHIIFEDPEKNTKTIIENLRNDRREVDLTNLQVYLDRLYSEDVKRIEESGETRPITFDSVLIEENVGKLPQVLSDFLEGQMTIVDRILEYPDISLMLLTAFVTNDGTKQSRHLNELIDELKTTKNIPPSVSKVCIQKFYERRILREFKLGDELQYEITHDLLARQIYNRFSAEEKGLRRATSMIEDAYDFHTELSKKGEGISFMTEEQLSYLQNIMPRLNLNETLLGYIEDSKTAITEEKEKEKLILQREVSFQKQQLEQEQKNKVLQQTIMEQERREHIKEQDEARKAREQNILELKSQRRRSLVSLIVGIAMCGLAIWAGIGVVQVKEQKRIVELEKSRNDSLLAVSIKMNDGLLKAKKDIEDTEKKREKERYDSFIEKGNVKKDDKKYREAITEYEGALLFTIVDSSKVLGLIKQCEYDFALLKKQEIFQLQFDTYIREGSRILDEEVNKPNQLLAAEDYIRAFEQIDSAHEIVKYINNTKNTDMVKSKMIETNKRLIRAFDIYKDKAERFKKVNGLKEAKTNLDRANLLSPAIEDLDKDIKNVKEIEKHKDSDKN